MKYLATDRRTEHVQLRAFELIDAAFRTEFGRPAVGPDTFEALRHQR